MSQRSILSFNTPSLQAPLVPTDHSLPTLLDQVSKQASRFADESIAIWQKSKIEQASVEGALAGGTPGVTYKDSSTLTGNAFNQAAKKTAISSLTNSTNAKLTQLQNQYYNKPDDYIKESSALINGATGVLRDNKETAVDAIAFEQKMRLEQQTQGYNISKVYNKEFIEQRKVEVDENLISTKISAYRNAAGIFSEDPQEKAIALNTYHTQSKMFEGYAHQTTPDGKEIFSSSDISNMKKEFNQGFFVRATKDYVTSGEIYDTEIVDILDGNIMLELPIDKEGNVVEVDVGLQVGVENIEKLKIFTEGKLREREALEEKRRKEAARLAKEKQEKIAADMAYQIASGEPITFDMIDNKLERGVITSKTALNARNQIIDYNDQDDIVALSVLNNSLAEGIDIDQLIAAYSNQLKSSTIISLRKANATSLEAGKVSASKTYHKMLSDEFGEKDFWGIFTEQHLVPVWNDISMEFNRRIDDGEDPELVFETLRPIVENAKEDAEKGIYKNIRDYIVKDKGKIEVLQSATALDTALDAGKISFEEYEAAMNRIIKAGSGE